MRKKNNFAPFHFKIKIVIQLPMKTKNLRVILLFFSMIFGGLFANGQTDADQIIKKMDATVFAVKDKEAHIKMVMVNLKTNKKKIKEAIIIQKGSDRKLFRYTFPKSDSGIATLSLPNNEIYLYLPLFKKPKKITNLAQKNAFNKSDFSVSDMATKAYSEKYSAQLISTNDTVFIVDLKPKSDDPAYSHLVAYINKKNYYPVQFDYYDSKNQFVKKSTYRYIKVSGYWISDVAAMEDLKKNHKTTIYMSDIKINQGLKDDLFTLENLSGK